MIIPPQGEKHCYVPCPEGKPCECRERLYEGFIKILDEEDEKIYGNPNTFLAHDLLPNSDQDVQVSDTTKAD